MPSGRHLFALSMILLTALGFAACSGPAQESAQDPAAAQAAELAWLEQAKTALDAKRQELRELREQVGPVAMEEEADAQGTGDAATAETTATEDAAAAGAEATPAERLKALQEEVNTMAQEFNDRLIAFINSQEIFVDTPLTTEQRRAFDMKADEDILVAQEYIDKGGNYQKAIDIYTTALLADPENEKLLAAKAATEGQRYMTEERFAQIKNDMTRDEVRAILGTPQALNIREFEGGVVGWFYPKAEPRSAAGVFFREKKGNLVVYKTDFNAVKGEANGSEP